MARRCMSALRRGQTHWWFQPRGAVAYRRPTILPTRRHRGRLPTGDVSGPMSRAAAMKLYDQHVHSRYSFDCDMQPEETVHAALEAGLAGLTFAEHFDTHPDEWGRNRYDDRAFSDEIARLRDRFSQQIFIGKGIEVCYQPDNMDFILDFLAAHQFDVILLSVHWADGRQMGWPEHCGSTSGPRRCSACSPCCWARSIWPS